MNTYHIDELNAMDEATMRGIAEEMGMKKAHSEDTEKVLEYILDNQAIGFAKEETSKGSRRNTSKEKKTRAKSTKKESAAPEPENIEAKPETPVETNNEENATLRSTRGRRASKPVEETAVEITESQTTSEDVAAENTTPVEPAPKRKPGRPKKTDVKPKSEAAPDTAVVDETTQQADAVNTKDAADKAESGAAVETAGRKQSPDAAARTGQNQSLNSFFNKGRTFTPKTFTPRAKQTEEEAPVENNNEAAPAEASLGLADLIPMQPAKPAKKQQQPAQFNNQTPVVINDPAQGNHQQKQHLTKKQMRMQRQQEMMQKKQQQRLNNAPFKFDAILSVYGVLEIMPEGFGLLRSPDYNYLPSPDDVFITPQQIKNYGLKPGDVVEADVMPPRDNDKHYTLAGIRSINGLLPEAMRDRVAFEHLVPLFPDEKFNITKGRTCNISTRVVDMFAPIGKGQRALIVAPPKTGKTILLKDIANSIAENHPDTYIIMLLIDERPEEVTDMARSVNAEVIASTFDEPAEHHVKIAGIVLEKAKRLVECGHDVVIMLDSITRLARAYNTVSPASGKILSGGVDANALQRPKRFFGAARNIENGGSLTIIATALTETSSKMDEVIFEEFKGTGNMELQLDRKLSNKRIFPAVDIISSSTRRDDLLLSDETLNRMWILRNYLSDMNSIEAMEFIKKRMEMTRSNEELLVTMDK